MVEGHCLQVMKIVHHHANGCFDWLISRQQSVNPSRKATSILYGKYKRFTFVHPACGFQHDSAKESSDTTQVCSYDTTQVLSSELALIKTNKKPIQNHRSKTMLLFKTYTPEFEFDRFLEHMVSYQGMQSGLPVFLDGEFGTSEIFMQK